MRTFTYHPSLATEEIIASCELWPWSADIFLEQLLLYAAFIAAIPLLAIYLKNSASYSDILCDLMEKRLNVR